MLGGSWSPALAFGAFLICELALVVLVASGRSSLTPVRQFDVSIAGPFAGFGAHVIQGQMAHRAAFVGLMAALCVCYLVLALQAPRVPPRLSLAAVAVACVVIVLGPPVRLTDVFNYVDFARLSVLHGLNPYVHAPVDALRDPAFKFTSWHHQPTPYGPLFTLLTYPLAWLGVAGAVWALKAATAAAAVGAAGLVGACARRLRQDPSRAVLLFGLNPVVLVYGLGGVHNDFFMELSLLAAIYLVLGERERLAGWAGAAAAGLKASAIPLLPFLALGARRRGRTLAWLLIAGVAVTALTLVIFGHRAPGLAQQQARVTRYSLPHVVATALGHGEYRRCAGGTLCATPATSWAALAVLVLGLAALLWWTWRHGDWITGAGWAAILFIASLTAIMPWYLMWVLPLAILSRSRRLWAGTVVLAAFILLPAGPGFVGT